MHAPFPNQRVFLLFANLIGNFKRDLSWRFACVRLVIQPLDSFLHPAFQRRVHRLFTHLQIRGNGGYRPARSRELHKVVTALRWIRSVVEERKATHLDGWRRTRSQHGLDRMMRGTPMKTRIADFYNLANGHVRHFHAQIDNELTHIWREASRNLLRLLARSGRKQTDHALLIESVGFALQASARLARLLCPLNRRIARFGRRGARVRKQFAPGRRVYCRMVCQFSVCSR